MGWISGERYPFTEQNVTSTSLEDGVYAIVKSDNTIIWVGRGHLRNRLTQHYRKQDQADPCIWRHTPTHYYREVCSNSEEKEKELLRNYKTLCNQKIG